MNDVVNSFNEITHLMLRTRIYSKVSYAASTYQKNWPLNSTNARMTMRPG